MIDRIQAGMAKTGALASHFSHTEKDLIGKLAFNRQIPLLPVWPTVPIHWAVTGAVAVGLTGQCPIVVARIDDGRKLGWSCGTPWSR